MGTFLTSPKGDIIKEFQQWLKKILSFSIFTNPPTGIIGLIRPC